MEFIFILQSCFWAVVYFQMLKWVNVEPCRWCLLFNVCFSYCLSSVPTQRMLTRCPVAEWCGGRWRRWTGGRTQAVTPVAANTVTPGWLVLERALRAGTRLQWWGVAWLGVLGLCERKQRTWMEMAACGWGGRRRVCTLGTAARKSVEASQGLCLFRQKCPCTW